MKDLKIEENKYPRCSNFSAPDGIYIYRRLVL